MILFSNGCSFLTTRPKDGVDTYTTKILAESYKMAMCNYAMGGRGNDRISFTTKVWLERHKRDSYFAVIGWSSQNRNDYCTNDNHKKGRMPQTDLTWRTWKTLDNVSFIRTDVGDRNKSLAFSLKFQSATSTLKDTEVDSVVKKILKSLHKVHGAIQR